MDIQQVIVNLKAVREVLDYSPADTIDDITNKSEKLSGILGTISETASWADWLYNSKVRKIINEGTVKVSYAAERTKCFDAAADIEFRSHQIAKNYLKSVYSQLDLYRSRLSLLSKEYEYNTKKSKSV